MTQKLRRIDVELVFRNIGSNRSILQSAAWKTYKKRAKTFKISKHNAVHTGTNIANMAFLVLYVLCKARVALW